MKKIFFAGLLITVILSNIGGFVRDGKKLDELRGSVLRLHILANSDTDYDQNLKIKVRDALLENSEQIFGSAESLSDAERTAREKLPQITETAEKVLKENGCNYSVKASVTDWDFDTRVYGDITMPSGNYKALRIEIGEAEGHNWWCVMYPPLCLPAVCDVEDNKETEAVFFDSKELDIMKNPQKYEIRFAVWDKLKEIFDR